MRGEYNIETIKIGTHKISRLICGANPFGGWAHSGDLKYLSRVFKEYFTVEKITETLILCAQNGVNTLVSHPGENVLKAMDLFEKEMGYRIQWICQIPPVRDEIGLEEHFDRQVQTAINNRAVCAFLQGAATEAIFREKKFDKLQELINLLKEKKIVPGLCSHKSSVIKKGSEMDLGAEFYMLTLNKVNYHSDDPEEVKSVMDKLDKPVFNFKVLGGGRDIPKSGFRLAFNTGAAAIVVGMFDFQIQENALLVDKILNSEQ